MTLDYSSYLELEQLLELQRPRTEPPEHDELLFIVIHQVYELWFKVVLQEGELLRGALEADDVTSARRALDRLLTIFRVMVDQVGVLETMTPTAFAAFRPALGGASGFQSYQFRELELLLGQRDPACLEHHAEGSPARKRLERRLAEPGLYVVFLRFLVRAGHPISPAALDQVAAAPGEPQAEVQKTLTKVYREDPASAQLCEKLADLDEILQLWRYRHVQLVERFLGSKMGTGGSTGAAYLRGTLFRPIFRDLWDIRAEI